MHHICHSGDGSPNFAKNEMHCVLGSLRSIQISVQLGPYIQEFTPLLLEDTKIEFFHQIKFSESLV